MLTAVQIWFMKSWAQKPINDIRRLGMQDMADSVYCPGLGAPPSWSILKHSMSSQGVEMGGASRTAAALNRKSPWWQRQQHIWWLEKINRSWWGQVSPCTRQQNLKVCHWPRWGPNWAVGAWQMPGLELVEDQDPEKWTELGEGEGEDQGGFLTPSPDCEQNLTRHPPKSITHYFW